MGVVIPVSFHRPSTKFSRSYQRQVLFSDRVQCSAVEPVADFPAGSVARIKLAAKSSSGAARSFSDSPNRPRPSQNMHRRRVLMSRDERRDMRELIVWVKVKKAGTLRPIG